MSDVDFKTRNGLVVNNFVLYANASTARVGVNNSNPDATLTVTGTANLNGVTTITGITTITANAVLSGSLQTISGNVNFDSGVLFVDSVNNRIGINNTTPDASITVTGSANVSGDVRFGGVTTLAANLAVSGQTVLSGNTSLQGSLQTISGNASFDSGVLFVDATNNRVGINNTSPDAALAVTGAANVSGQLVVGTDIISGGRGSFGGSAANVVANSSGLFVSNSTVNTALKIPTAAQYSGQYFLHANGSYVIPSGGLTIGGANTQIQFNDSSDLSGSAGLTFNKTSNNITVANNIGACTVTFTSTISGGNTQLGTSFLNIANATVNTYVTVGSINTTSGLFNTVNVGLNVSITTSALSIGNSTVNSYVNSSIVSTSGTLIALSSVNVGSNAYINTSALSIGNSTVSAVINSSSLSTGSGIFSAAANVGANVSLSTAALSIGNSTVNSYVNSSIVATGSVTASNVAVGANVSLSTVRLQVTDGVLTTTVNSTAITVGSVTINSVATMVGANVFVDVSGLSIGNSTVNTYANSSTIQTTGSLGVGTLASGTAGQIRATNDVTAFYSDIRLKTNIEVINQPIEKLRALDGVYYNVNDLARSFGFTDKEDRQVGVLAQQVQAVLPEAVQLAPFDSYWDANNMTFVSTSGQQYLTVQYEKLVPLLIEAVKTLEERLKKLESK